MGTQNKKGDLLEEAVRMAYAVPGLKAETGADVPSALLNSERMREVDVLLSSKSPPMQVAIECKNHGKAVVPSQIDQFVGLLHDIGLPHSQGLFIASHKGFTEPARVYAQEAGIQALCLDGLTDDRLAIAVNQAVQSMVFLVGTSNLSLFAMPLPCSEGDIALEVEKELDRGGIYTLLWTLWMQGQIPAEIGNPTVCIRHGGGTVHCDFFVDGYVASLPGQATHLVLRDAENGGVVREHVTCKFESPENALPLTRFTTEDAMQEALEAAKADVRVVHRIKVPRLALHGEGAYWPPTKEAAQRVAALRREGKPVSLLGSPASLGTPQKGPDGPGQQERPRGSRSPPFEASPGPAHPVSQEPRRAPGLARVVPETIEGPESAVRPLQGPFCCGPAIDLEGGRCGKCAPEPSLKQQESRLLAVESPNIWTAWDLFLARTKPPGDGDR